MTTAQILKDARELISDERRWTRGATARDKDGDQCSSYSTDAVCWCSYGAVFRVTRAATDYVKAIDALNAVIQSFSWWQDRATHAEVMAAFDLAIERLEVKP